MVLFCCDYDCGGLGLFWVCGCLMLVCGGFGCLALLLVALYAWLIGWLAGWCLIVD